MNTSLQSSDIVINSPLGVGGINILLEKAGKRFNRDWIFRNLTYSFSPHQSYAIVGPNGSGKSTLLQAIAAAINVSEGVIEYSNSKFQIPNEEVYKYISIAAPYLDVIEEMTAKEFLQFHSTFKPFISNTSIAEIIAMIGLEKAADKQIRYYSSGMKQRIKLAQAIFSDTAALLLDEPCTNLDKTGIDLYHQLIKNYCSNKLIIVSSNDEVEYNFCKEKLNILDWK
jgi:ABC-type multidrug transport system ATPase subunit